GYYKQRFAQVTNPPIDPIREETVMSLVSSIGGEGNLLTETPRQCRRRRLPPPAPPGAARAKIRRNARGDFRACTLAMRFPRPASVRKAGVTLYEALEELCREGSRAIDDGAPVIILSDRDVGPDFVPIPSLLATAALHHHLIRTGQRVRAGVIVETAEAREVMHLALLIGFGAGAVCPYLALDTVTHLGLDAEKSAHNYVKALCKGLLKTMSKMGISAVSSYQGAQVFEAVGIDQVVIDKYFTGTSSRMRGVGLQRIAEESMARHARAYGPFPADKLDVGGHYHYRAGGEAHLWTPKSVASLQRAVRQNDAKSFDEYSELINAQTEQAMTLRGLWDFAPAGDPVPLEEVEP